MRLSDKVGEVIVKVELAVPPKVSVATTTFEPGEELGTPNVQSKAPEIEVTQVEGEVDTAAPLKDIVTVVDAGNPLLVAVTKVPIGPVVGLSDRVGTVTTNNPLAVLPKESVAVNDCAPMEDEGTVNVQLKSPELAELHDAASFVVSNAMDTLAEGAKPLPVRVTEVPTAPLVGVTDIDGGRTVKLWLAVFPCESTAVTI